MKRFLLALALLPALAFAGPSDIVTNQRNATDTSSIPRTVAKPPGTQDGLMGFNGSTVLPVHWTIGTGLQISSGSLVALPQAWTDITGKPAFAPVATAGTYASLTGIPSTFPPSAHTQAWSTITSTPTTLAGYGVTDAYPLTGNPSGFLTGITSGQVTAALGFTPYNATNPSAYINQAGARSAISLTTTGTSGAATYNSATGVLNVPNYATPVAPSINDSPARTLVTTTTATGFQISATRVAHVCYEGSFSTTSTIGGPSSASVFLETADTNSTTPGDWTTKAQQTYSNTITLAVVLNQVQGNNWSICRYIPAGKFVRIRSGSINGTASATINTTQQEVLL
jgi:hypothetical protein